MLIIFRNNIYVYWKFASRLLIVFFFVSFCFGFCFIFYCLLDIHLVFSLNGCERVYFSFFHFFRIMEYFIHLLFGTEFMLTLYCVCLWIFDSNRTPEQCWIFVDFFCCSRLIYYIASGLWQMSKHLSSIRFKRFNTMTVQTQWSDEQINMNRSNRNRRWRGKRRCCDQDERKRNHQE